MCTYTQSEHALPHWKYVLRCCTECPCIYLPDHEKKKRQHPQLGFTFITSLDVVLLMVKLHWRTRKYVTCVNKNLYQIHLQKYTPETSSLWWRQPYLIFIFYILAMQKLSFQLPHVRILGTNHCGEMRHTAFKRRELFQDALCCRDYSERAVASFDNQIQ